MGLWIVDWGRAGNWVPRCASGLRFAQRGRLAAGLRLGLFCIFGDWKAGETAAVREIGFVSQNR